MRCKPKIRHFKDGTQALHALAKGEIALTIAPMTSIRVVPGVALAGPLPDALQSTTVYAAALSRKSAASEPAKALHGDAHVAGLRGGAARQGH